MSGYVPSGYFPLSEIRDAMGGDELGRFLADGSLVAAVLTEAGEMEEASSSLWRSLLAKEAMAAGGLRLPSGEVVELHVRSQNRRVLAAIMELRAEKEHAASKAEVVADEPRGWRPRPGQSLRNWCNSAPAVQEAERAVKARGDRLSQGKTNEELERLWRAAGGECADGSIGRLRRK